MRHSLHFYLHDLYGYIVFLIHVPFHLRHKSEGYPDYDLFTLRGSIYCECGYHYDRGYYLMKCKKCYGDEVTRAHKKLKSESKTIDEVKTCERCGANTARLYHFEYRDEEYADEIQSMEICWDCDFDCSNGGDLYADAGDIYQDRREQAYAYDPINNERPW